MKTMQDQSRCKTTALTLSLLLFMLAASRSFSQTNEEVPVPVSFQSEGHAVKGLFYPGSMKEGRYTAILLRGFPGGEGDVIGMGQSLSNAGINALTFNYSGTFKSEGVQSFETPLKDIKSAFDFLRQPDMMLKYHIDTTRIILIGYCYGGSMALNYAARHPEIRRVIGLVITEHGEFAREYLRNKEMAMTFDSLFDSFKQPNGPVNFQGKEELKKLAQNPAPYDMVLNAPKIADRDILLVTAWDDFITMTEMHHLPLYRALKKAGAAHVRMVAYQSNHSLRNVREELANELVRWIQSE
jgi:pimeloyl-ACP methyl ester carboxylesterase